MTKLRIVFILLIVFLVVGCSALKLRPIEQRAVDPRTEAEKIFNPLGFEQDKEIITQVEYDKASKAETKQKGKEVFTESDSLRKEADEYVTIYRVQVYASKVRSQTEAFADSVRTKLGSEKLHIEYQAPYYKIRLGDCKSFDEAEELLVKIEKNGFKEVWIVKTRIKVGDGD